MLLGSLFFDLLAPGLIWKNELFHDFLEGSGSLISFALAVFIAAMISRKRLTANFVWLAVCFIVMGGMDLAHSLLHPGQPFVWLHSAATFFGGLFAAMIWLPPVLSAKFFNVKIFLLAIVFTVVFSIGSIVWPEITLPMLDEEKHFTISAMFINVSGGVLFAIAWLYFFIEKRNNPADETIYFSNQFFLFFLAGVLFQFSLLWDGNWWLWHILRAIAYGILLLYFGRKYWLDMLEIEEKDRAKSRFFANMSHELRTPMHGILSYARMGVSRVETAPREKIKRYLTNIQISGDRLLSLLDNLLDLSKMESGKMELSIQQNDFGILLQSCIAEFDAKFKEIGLEIKIITPEKTINIYCDELRIKQVIINLLSNAIKFSPKNSIIEIEYCKNNNDRVEFYIRDQGPGIEKDRLNSIFEKFVQDDSDETGLGMGSTGLGLAICKEIILAHKGEISALENIEIGAVFSFSLPIEPIQE